MAGYTANVTSGTAVVNGAALVLEIGWSASESVPQLYTVTFAESGLTPGASWSVNLAGTTPGELSGTSTVLAQESLADGSYSYTVPDVGSYVPTTSSGTFVIAGANVTVDVDFQTHTVTPAAAGGGSHLSILDLIVFVLVVGGIVGAVYLIHRLEGAAGSARAEAISSRRRSRTGWRANPA